MTALQSGPTLALFRRFAATLHSAPEVCPEIPLPSAWAAEKLGFQAEPAQLPVLDRNTHRLILCGARQWGKTTLIAVKALHAAHFQPGTQIIVVASSERQAGRLISKTCAMAALLHHPRRRVPGYRFSLQLPNGSSLCAVSHSDKTGPRGLTADILIVDEAAHVADHVIAAASPTLFRTGGQMWLLSVPRGQQGLFYNIWHHPASGEWVRIKATIEDFPAATPAYIEEQKRIFAATYRQELFCEFAVPKNRIFTTEMVDSMLIK